MTKLTRCSPEIERELHDKEARIRELEAALRDVDEGLLHYVVGIPHLDTAAKMHRLRIKHLLAAALPGSKPVPRWRDVSREWTLCEDTGRLAEQGECPEHEGDACLRQYAPVGDSEPAEQIRERCTPFRGSGLDLKDYLQDWTPREPAEGEDAMLERREAPGKILGYVNSPRYREDGSVIPNERIIGVRMKMPDPFREDVSQLHPPIAWLRQALSRTSDEGTGCVVSEAVRRLPERWRNEDADYFGAPETLEARCALEKCADELDRALAQQGGQQSDASRTANIAALDHAADILDPDTPVAVRGAHSDHWKRAAARNLRDISDQMRKAAAPQPEHGESDE